MKPTETPLRNTISAEVFLHEESPILPILQEIDRACAAIAYEMALNRCPDDVIAPFNRMWDELKRLIQEIQQGGSKP